VNLTTKTLIVGGIFAGGIFIGSYFNSSNTVQEKIVYRDKIKTITREVTTTKPDGSKVTVIETDKTENKDVTKDLSVKTQAKKNYGIGVKYDLFSPVPVYTLEVHRRLFGDFYISASGSTETQFNIGVTVFF
jgi:hypothetical protein